MEHLTNCDLCQNITTAGMGSSRSNKQNYQEITLKGSCTVLLYGVKSYVRKCCIKTLYLGSHASSYCQQKLFSTIKIKAPKYVSFEDSKCMVYEITLKNNEIIDRPDGFSNLDKLEIFRYLNYNNYQKEYEFITKSKFDNKNITCLDKTQNITSNDIKECDNFQYIYLLQERTAVAINKPIYKIGRTSQLNFERFKAYGKGYKILLHVVCDDCINLELRLINLFKSKYIQSTQYGNEYFEGDHKSMIKDILYHI